MKIQIISVDENKLTALQRSAVEKLNAECFRDVPSEEVEENFIAESFARLFAYDGGQIIGMLRLFKRTTDFSNKQIVFGGLGGVCVTEKMRHKGIAKLLVEKGMRILRDQKCDVACLNVDLEKTAYKLYEKIGFTLMKRPISFTNSKGQRIQETGTMFVPLLSQDVYNLVMNSSETFNYGNGYW